MKSFQFQCTRNANTSRIETHLDFPKNKMDVQEEKTSESREKDALQRVDEVHKFLAYKII